MLRANEPGTQNFRHLEHIGKVENREYMEVFRLNVLHAKHKNPNQHMVSVREMLEDQDTADRMRTDMATGPIPSMAALHALDRVRQLANCDMPLLSALYFSILNYLDQALNYINNLNKDMSATTAQQFTELNTKMGAQLEEALDNDIRALVRKYRDQSWAPGGRETFSKWQAVQKVADFRRNFNNCQLAQEDIQSCLEEGCSLHICLIWLTELHTIYRGKASTNMDIDPGYMLFIAPCYKVIGEPSQGIVLSPGNVVVVVTESDKVHHNCG